MLFEEIFVRAVPVSIGLFVAKFEGFVPMLIVTLLAFFPITILFPAIMVLFDMIVVPPPLFL